MRIFVPKLLKVPTAYFIENQFKGIDWNMENKTKLFEILVYFTGVKVPRMYSDYQPYKDRRFRFDKRIWWSKAKFKVCAICSAKKYIHRHHIIPLGKGGINMKLNLIALCRVCHKKVHKNEPSPKKEFVPKIKLIKSNEKEFQKHYFD